MNILIANVGNIRRNEIKVLAEMLNKKHNVTIASMATESSYKGQAFSFHSVPVRVNTLLYKEIIKNHETGTKPVTKNKLSAFDNIAAYEFYSEPADAVSVMLGEIMIAHKPDLVICGIGNGSHMGKDLYCSSSIGMAMEVAFFRTPVIAIGMEYQPGGHSEEQVAPAVKFLEKNFDKIANMKLPVHTFLNIAIPSVEKYEEYKGVKVAPTGDHTILNTFIEKTDPKGEKYYWAQKNHLSGGHINEDKTSAPYWYNQGYIVLTPISYDATDYHSISNWESTVSKLVKEESETADDATYAAAAGVAPRGGAR